MELAAAIEQKSTHPLANAIVAAHCGCVADMVENDIQLPNVRKVIVTDGVGVSGWAESEPDFWQHVSIGNERLLKSNGGRIHVSPRQDLLVSSFYKASQGKVVLIVAVDDKLQLIMSLSDELRPEAADFVKTMQDKRMCVSMLTGDQEEVASDICEQVGISSSDCYFRLLPRQKLEWIVGRQTPESGARGRTTRKGDKVIMVGDGINDSTALSAAVVGVAMGAGGSAMAVASANVILMTDDLMLIPATIELCNSAYYLVIQNFIFSISVKVIAIVLALMGRLQFWEAVLVDIGTLLVVLANGIRPLFKSNFPSKITQP
jgi:cation transport ATPase